MQPVTRQILLTCFAVRPSDATFLLSHLSNFIRCVHFHSFLNTRLAERENLAPESDTSGFWVTTAVGDRNRQLPRSFHTRVCSSRDKEFFLIISHDNGRLTPAVMLAIQYTT